MALVMVGEEREALFAPVWERMRAGAAESLL